jgi:hypothetical protein
MSLAFALMAAINGSTGSSATLSYGLKGTKPRRRQPGGGKILTAPRWRRKPSETLFCESSSGVLRRGKMAATVPRLSRVAAESRPLRGQHQRPGDWSGLRQCGFSFFKGGGRPPGTLFCESPSWRPRLGRSRFVGCARRRQAGSAGVGAQAVAAAPSSVACSVTV